MKKIMSSVCAVFTVAMLGVLVVGSVGCSMLDFNGDGRFDPVTYLASVDIDVAWSGDDGSPYQIAVDENGVRLAGKFTSPKTGLTYALTETGGFTITDPNGIQVRIKSK